MARITDWSAACTKYCEPEADVHSEACIKAFFRITKCQYCCDGGDCMICGRSSKIVVDSNSLRE